MARITVEDCLENVENIFEMVLVAAKRARRIAHGADPMVELENDKPTVLALREIADGLVTSAILDEIEQPAADELMQPCVPFITALLRRLPLRLRRAIAQDWQMFFPPLADAQGASASLEFLRRREILSLTRD